MRDNNRPLFPEMVQLPSNVPKRKRKQQSIIEIPDSPPKAVAGSDAQGLHLLANAATAATNKKTDDDKREKRERREKLEKLLQVLHNEKYSDLEAHTSSISTQTSDVVLLFGKLSELACPPDNADGNIIPVYCSREIQVPVGANVTLRTDVVIEFPQGIVGEVMPSMFSNKSVALGVQKRSLGSHSNNRELLVEFRNITNQAVLIKRGERIGDIWVFMEVFPKLKQKELGPRDSCANDDAR